MNINKKLIVASTAAGLVGIFGAAGVVGAATNSIGTSKDSSLVQKLSDKFHLNKADVQKVFDDEHTSREADRQKQLDERLTQAVKDGKLTADQKTKLEAKLKELQAACKDAKHDRATMKAERDSLKKWATDNGINLENVMPFPTGGIHMGHEPDGDADDVTTATN